MTMGEGGAVYTDNPLLNKVIRSLRDWEGIVFVPPEEIICVVTDLISNMENCHWDMTINMYILIWI